MKKLIYLVAFLLTGALALPHAAHAQVKIGANPGTIGASSGLEVEAANGKKVIVNKADGSMVVENAPTSTTNTFLLTTDANGLVSKQIPSSQTLPPVVIGTFGSGRDISSGFTHMGTNSSITLPAKSKYVVNIVLTLNGSSATSSTGSALVRATLSNVSTDGVGGSSDIIGAGSTIGVVSTSAFYGVLTGTLLINNTSASPKTYYLKGSVDANSPGGGSYNLPSGYFVNKFGGSVFSEGQLYAVPAN